jgi:hypothetical protein
MTKEQIAWQEKKEEKIALRRWVRGRRIEDVGRVLGN